MHRKTAAPTHTYAQWTQIHIFLFCRCTSSHNDNSAYFKDVELIFICQAFDHCRTTLAAEEDNSCFWHLKYHFLDWLDVVEARLFEIEINKNADIENLKYIYFFFLFNLSCSNTPLQIELICFFQERSEYLAHLISSRSKQHVFWSESNETQKQKKNILVGKQAQGKLKVNGNRVANQADGHSCTHKSQQVIDLNPK